MNGTDYTFLLNKPDAINQRYADSLEKIIEQFPYFQSARVMVLKHLYNQDSYKYNQALKSTAAYTCDRSILFDFITSNDFKAVQKGLYEKKLEELLNIQVVGSEIIFAEKPHNNSNPLEQSILSSIQTATPETVAATENLSIGKPLPFSKEEKHSFEEWLQIARFNPIQREVLEETSSKINQEKQKKIALIDQFIENNPKIPPISKEAPTPTIAAFSEETTYLMTETLARVYLEQKKIFKSNSSL